MGNQTVHGMATTVWMGIETARSEHSEKQDPSLALRMTKGLQVRLRIST